MASLPHHVGDLFSNGTQWAQAPKTWLGIGFAMKEHHLHLMASDCFKHAIARIQKKEDLSPEVYLALSHCLHRSHNRKEALAVLESAVLLFEEDPAIMEAYEKLNEEYAAKVKAEAAAALLFDYARDVREAKHYFGSTGTDGAMPHISSLNSQSLDARRGSRLGRLDFTGAQLLK